MEFPGIVSRVLPGDLLHNPPVLSLIIANVITIVFAILGNWDLATVMFIYWAQSIIIGIFAVISLLSADTAALGADLQKPIDERGGTEKITPRFVWLYKCMLAGFFTLHYGLFHWGYFTFIVESGIFGTVNFADPNLWLSCGLFFANHLSLVYHLSVHGAKGRRVCHRAVYYPVPSDHSDAHDHHPRQYRNSCPGDFRDYLDNAGAGALPPPQDVFGYFRPSHQA